MAVHLGRARYGEGTTVGVPVMSYSCFTDWLQA
jgi:hypothetical protein